ncbi:hypothetical protein [Acidicapsa acidisoli]|uniref:hypothetical protein n=1 Tax=Acidicapsa acidisoli TaxID=1615681 RepID=UPI0021DFAD5A|nr:hypothetical protein [Acidicapsa acidisoli]
MLRADDSLVHPADADAAPVAIQRGSRVLRPVVVRETGRRLCRFSAKLQWILFERDDADARGRLPLTEQ